MCTPWTEADLDEVYAVPPGRHVRANMVTSLDGLVQVEGLSGGLSGPADRRVFATLRGLTDVVLVGAETARAENYGPARPSPERQRDREQSGLAAVPPIAVVSGRLALEPDARLFAGAVARPIVLTCAAAPADRVRRLEPVADVVVAGDERVDLARALDALAGRGLVHVLAEGGPRLLEQLVAADLLDELCLTLSPTLVGGRDGRRLLGGPGLTAPAHARLRGAVTEDEFVFLRYALR